MPAFEVIALKDALGFRVGTRRGVLLGVAIEISLDRGAERLLLRRPNVALRLSLGLGVSALGNLLKD